MGGARSIGRLPAGPLCAQIQSRPALGRDSQESQILPKGKKANQNRCGDRGIGVEGQAGQLEHSRTRWSEMETVSAAGRCFPAHTPCTHARGHTCICTYLRTHIHRPCGRFQAPWRAKWPQNDPDSCVLGTATGKSHTGPSVSVCQTPACVTAMALSLSLVSGL